jgi:signal transduction histidine kinase
MDTTHLQPLRHTTDFDTPTATLEDVDIRSELQSRPARPPNYENEDRVLAVLAKEMAENPRNMLQKLVEVAVQLCAADTAGISLLEGDVFRWEAVAGVFASYRNGTMPRAASPCGVCIDRNSTQLMHLADRCFPALKAEPRFVEALLIPFHHQGKPVGTVWVVAHTFERKFDRQDERIMRTLSQFASAGWQLWKAYEAAEQSNHRKDEFLAMLGHELRNPLSAIVTAAQILQEQEPRRIGEGARRAIEVMGRQSQQLSRMVDDMLDVTRISKGKLQLVRRRVNVQKVVADAAETVRSHIAQKHHHLLVELPAVPIHLEADPGRLAQMLSNLLHNAAKYSPPGSEIRLTAVQTSDEVEISVRDTGEGIAKDQLSSVFDLFTQLGNRSGLGLGLTLVRRLAEMHGGTVEAASEGPSKGSAFTIRLPVRAITDTSSATGSKPTDASTSRRVLLVENSADLAESVAMPQD